MRTILFLASSPYLHPPTSVYRSRHDTNGVLLYRLSPPPHRPPQPRFTPNTSPLRFPPRDHQACLVPLWAPVYSLDRAVHGLNGALSLRVQSPLPHGFRHPDHSFTRRPRRFLLPVNRTTAASPIIPSTDLSQQNRTAVSPVPNVALNNRTNRTAFAEANRTTPESESIHPYSPADTTENLGVLQPEDHIPAKHSGSFRASLLETGNDDHGHDESSSEAPSPLDVQEDGMITGKKSWLLDGQTEGYTITQ